MGVRERSLVVSKCWEGCTLRVERASGNGVSFGGYDYYEYQ